jgi:succinyl-CoA synthetase beta subunit
MPEALRMDDPLGAPAESAVITGLEAIALLAGRVPVAWPWGATIATPADVPALHASLKSFPVVAKAEGLAHRNHVGAVWTGVADAGEAELVARAFGAHFGYPLSFSEQIAHDREFILGARRTAGDHVLCLVGAGGTGVGERVRMLLSPADAVAMRRAVAEFASPVAEVTELVEAMSAVQGVLLDDADRDIAAIDLNPVVFSRDSGQLYALDVKIFLNRAGGA